MAKTGMMELSDSWRKKAILRGVIQVNQIILLPLEAEAQKRQKRQDRREWHEEICGFAALVVAGVFILILTNMAFSI